MKIVVKVRYVSDGTEDRFHYDMTNCSDYDDLIRGIEEVIWDKMKEPLRYKVGFEIVNEIDIYNLWFI